MNCPELRSCVLVLLVDESDLCSVFQLYRDAAECMNLLSQRLGSHKFFFGDS